MNINKLECPSCGASLEMHAPICDFCKNELRFFEEEGAYLPLNLNAENLESNIIHHESEFWQATINAIDAPYSCFKEFKHYNIQNFKNDYSVEPYNKCLKMFYDTFFILPQENFITLASINNIGGYVLLTSLRVVIYRGTTLLSIPLENFISWGVEKSVSGTTVIGRSGREVVGQNFLRYKIGEYEKKIEFDPDDLFISGEVMQSVLMCKEWNDINSLQKNILSIYRYKLNKIYKFQIKPLELMEVKKVESKGCFIATATMGDYNHPNVIFLQNFRDNYLIHKNWGKHFIKMYCTYGPSLARIIKNNFILKKISFLLIITPMVTVLKIFKGKF